MKVHLGASLCKAYLVPAEDFLDKKRAIIVWGITLTTFAPFCIMIAG